MCLKPFPIYETGSKGPTKAVATAAQTLSSRLTDNPVLSEYAGRTTSLSSIIIDTIKAVQGANHQWNEPPGEKEYRAVLASESSLVAALSGGQLRFLVSRDRVATAVARATLKG